MLHVLFGSVLDYIASLFRVVRLFRALRNIDSELTSTIDRADPKLLTQALQGACEFLADSLDTIQSNTLAVDIGATRTKFLLISPSGSPQLLEPLMSRELWGKKGVRIDGSNVRSSSIGMDCDPQAAVGRMVKYVQRFVRLENVTKLVFGIPGTVDITTVQACSPPSIIRNMPSFDPSFRGFDIKKHYKPHFQNAKISAIADNMAAALGVASRNRQLQNCLVVSLGTAPAVSTFFRDPHVYKTKEKTIETGIWQPWVWFTKIELKDRYGYCGGLKVENEGLKLTLKPPTMYKIPHRQARIRFALDDATWLRLLGKCPDVPLEFQGNLSEAEATVIWVERVNAALTALAQKFHSVYGPLEAIWIVGGNSVRCRNHITTSTYIVPDSTKNITRQVPVFIPESDFEQQQISLEGLVYSTQFKVKQVFAPGQDPLARGWTRGGEIYVWVKR
eukprot:c2397_g1_i1.p1 GENE.c2397_g1_i1~~c2397_g1_i1.p1  ORF type:complete len:447 (-),score=97.43 c2397_g1_i1:8-1348(-)